jgi:RNA polymerase sigma-70 factor (ECF subfamily)
MRGRDRVAKEAQASRPILGREAAAGRDPIPAELAEHLDSLYAAALRLSSSAAEAEDLVQETCLKAHRARQQLRSPRKLRAWLLAILCNQFFNRRRSEKRRITFVDLPLEQALAAEVAESGSNIELRLVLREALDALEPEFRIVVWLADAEGLTSQEIARLLRLPQGTVASRLFGEDRSLEEFWGEVDPWKRIVSKPAPFFTRWTSPGPHR